MLITFYTEQTKFLKPQNAIYYIDSISFYVSELEMYFLHYAFKMVLWLLMYIDMTVYIVNGVKSSFHFYIAHCFSNTYDISVKFMQCSHKTCIVITIYWYIATTSKCRHILSMLYNEIEGDRVRERQLVCVCAYASERKKIKKQSSESFICMYMWVKS